MDVRRKFPHYHPVHLEELEEKGRRGRERIERDNLPGFEKQKEAWYGNSFLQYDLRKRKEMKERAEKERAEKDKSGKL